MNPFGSAGLQKMCPGQCGVSSITLSRAPSVALGDGFVSTPKSVSEVPRLTLRPPAPKRMPTTLLGLSPAKATTEQACRREPDGRLVRATADLREAVALAVVSRDAAEER